MLMDTLVVTSAGSPEPDLACDALQHPPCPAAQGSSRPAEPARRKRKAWAPNDDDHSIYRWAKVECQSQHYVAELFGISQSTVSRIVERYEKWQAHAEARASGQLDHAERVRAQRALTYLRNEKIIASCLRLAGEVEGCRELTGSTSAAPDGGLAGMREIRLVSKMLDRTGMASRFLRLAHRVGMEQLELVEKEPAIAPAPLSEEDEAEQEAQAAADRAELQAARDMNLEEYLARSPEKRAQRAEEEAARSRSQAEQARQELAGVLELLAETQRELAEAQAAAEDRESGSSDEQETEAPCDNESEGAELAVRQSEEEAVAELNLHNLHHPNHSKNGTSAGGACACDSNCAAEKNGARVHDGQASPAEPPPPDLLLDRRRQTIPVG